MKFHAMTQTEYTWSGFVTGYEEKGTTLHFDYTYTNDTRTGCFDGTIAGEQIEGKWEETTFNPDASRKGKATFTRGRIAGKTLLVGIWNYGGQTPNRWVIYVDDD